MLSSIFSSDVRNHSIRVDRFTVMLLCTVSAMLLAAELVTALYFDRVSKVHRAQAMQRRTLLEVKDSPSSRPSHIALLGNSLLLEGVNIEALSEGIAPQYVAAP